MQRPVGELKIDMSEEQQDHVAGRVSKGNVVEVEVRQLTGLSEDILG